VKGRAKNSARPSLITPLEFVRAGFEPRRGLATRTPRKLVRGLFAPLFWADVGEIISTPRLTTGANASGDEAVRQPRRVLRPTFHFLPFTANHVRSRAARIDLQTFVSS
jgi:hypothetical protein